MITYASFLDGSCGISIWIWWQLRSLWMVWWQWLKTTLCMRLFLASDLIFMLLCRDDGCFHCVRYIFYDIDDDPVLTCVSFLQGSMIPCMGMMAASLGVNGIFIEVDDDPGNAPCDGRLQWPLEKLLRKKPPYRCVADVCCVNLPICHVMANSICVWRVPASESLAQDLLVPWCWKGVCTIVCVLCDGWLVRLYRWLWPGTPHLRSSHFVEQRTRPPRSVPCKNMCMNSIFGDQCHAEVNSGKASEVRNWKVFCVQL